MVKLKKKRCQCRENDNFKRLIKNHFLHLRTPVLLPAAWLARNVPSSSAVLLSWVTLVTRIRYLSVALGNTKSTENWTGTWLAVSRCVISQQLFRIWKQKLLPYFVCTFIGLLVNTINFAYLMMILGYTTTGLRLIDMGLMMWCDSRLTFFFFDEKAPSISICLFVWLLSS